MSQTDFAPAEAKPPVAAIQCPDEQRAGLSAHLISQPHLLGSVVALDAFILAATAATAWWLAGPAGGATPLTWPLAAVIAAATIIAMQSYWTYTVAALRSPVSQVSKVTLGMAVAFGGALAITSVLGQTEQLPQDWLKAWASLGWLGLLGTRVLLARRLRAWSAAGRLIRRTVIIGGGKNCGELIEMLERSAKQSIQILGIFDDRGDDRVADTFTRYSKLGGFGELVEFCREQRVDLLIVTLPPSAEDRILHVLKKLWVLPIDIRISAHASKLRLRPRAYSYIGEAPFLAVFDKPLSDWSAAIKALEDRLLGVLMLVLLSPVMALVALAVKLDSKGPVFFRQTRHGFNNEKIGVYKFRSMHAEQSDANAVTLVTKGDPRVTKVGRFIRKTSLDELPQLFNVLRGELSLVGPRPHALQAKAGSKVYDEVVDGYYARHRMKPGITGWAQISGWRGETDTPEKIQRRVECDLHYIDNWSVLLDLYILAMTPVSLLNTKNAY